MLGASVQQAGKRKRTARRVDSHEEAASSRSRLPPQLEQFLGMLLYEKKNLGYRDFLATKLLEEQIEALDADATAADRQAERLELVERRAALLSKAVSADGDPLSEMQHVEEGGAGEGPT